MSVKLKRAKVTVAQHIRQIPFPFDQRCEFANELERKGLEMERLGRDPKQIEAAPGREVERDLGWPPEDAEREPISLDTPVVGRITYGSRERISGRYGACVGSAG